MNANYAQNYAISLTSRDVTGHVTIWYPMCYFL